MWNEHKIARALHSMKTRKLFTVVPMTDANGTPRDTFVSLHKGTHVHLYKTFDLNPNISVDVDIIHWITGPVPFRFVVGREGFCARYNADHDNYELRFPFGYLRGQAHYCRCKIHVEPKHEQAAAESKHKFMVEAELFDAPDVIQFRDQLHRAGFLATPVGCSNLLVNARRMAAYFDRSAVTDVVRVDQPDNGYLLFSTFSVVDIKGKDPEQLTKDKKEYNDAWAAYYALELDGGTAEVPSTDDVPADRTEEPDDSGAAGGGGGKDEGDVHGSRACDCGTGDE